jgi:hypothetical protein
MSEQITGSLVGKEALIGDTSTWFMLFVVAGIVGICFIIARYVISEGKERNR